MGKMLPGTNSHFPKSHTVTFLPAICRSSQGTHTHSHTHTHTHTLYTAGKRQAFMLNVLEQIHIIHVLKQRNTCLYTHTHTHTHTHTGEHTHTHTHTHTEVSTHTHTHTHTHTYTHT